ncbi:MAG: hypothetical protein AB7T49_11240 [Oligoflexales bacterium]
MNLKLASLSLSCLFLIQCKSIDRKSRINTAETCELSGFPKSDAFSSAVNANCNADFGAMMEQSGCKLEGRSLINETGHYFPAAPESTRKIDFYACGESFVMLSHPDEIIANVLDGADEILQYYKGSNGSFKFLGNSFDEHECKTCHDHGQLNMKEIETPWPNWSSVALDGKPLVNQGELLQGAPFFDAFFLESMVEDSQKNLANTAIKRMKAGERPFEDTTVKDALKPLFCDSTVELIALSSTENPQTFIDLRIFIDDKLRETAGGSFGSLKIDLTKWNEIFDRRNISVEPALKSSDPDRMKIGFFPMIALRKPGMDTRYVAALETNNVIDKGIALAAALVDFPNPVQSKLRCEIFDQLPTSKIKKFKTPQKLRKELESTLAKSTHPGAKNFASNLKAMEELDLTNDEEVKSFVRGKIERYMESCKTNPKSIANNLDDLYLTLRSRVVRATKMPIMEEFALGMFPESEKLRNKTYQAEGEKFRVSETCELAKN